MVGTYNGWLVVLSVVVAIVASYVALDLALLGMARTQGCVVLADRRCDIPGLRHLVDAFRRHAGVPFTDPDVV